MNEIPKLEAYSEYEFLKEDVPKGWKVDDWMNSKQYYRKSSVLAQHAALAQLLEPAYLLAENQRNIEIEKGNEFTAHVWKDFAERTKKVLGVLEKSDE